MSQTNPQPETSTISGLRERLRAAKTVADARRAVANVPPETLVRLVADMGRERERPEAVARRQNIRFALVLAALCCVYMTFVPILMGSDERFPREARTLVLYVCRGSQLALAIWTLWRTIANSSRDRIGPHVAPLLIDAFARLTPASAADLLAVVRTFVAAPAILFPSRALRREQAYNVALRDALVRILPLVMPGAATAFSAGDLTSLRNFVVRSEYRGKDPTSGDADLAVAGWLALSALVDASAMTPELRETLLADAARVGEFGHFAHVRAAAGEFQEAARAKPLIQKLSLTTDEPVQQQQRLG